MAYNNLLTYLGLNETFKIHTDASEFQLGEVIIQKGKPITFYSKKLTDAQQRYTVTERELLVEPSPRYSVLCRFHEGNTSKTKIYDREMSYGQTVKML